MTILASFAVPHPPIILPEVGRGEERKIAATTAAYEAAMKQAAEFQPDTLIITSPHAEMYLDYFHIAPGREAQGNFAQFGASQVKISVQYDRDLAALIADTIACAFGAVLLSFALSYLTRELSDGTPFVDDTALQLRRLGVLTIVLPIVSIVLQMIPYAVFDLSAPDRLDNAGSVILGVVLILASLVFRYGAELAQSKEMN